MSISDKERVSERWADDGGNVVATQTPDYFSPRTFQIPALKGISQKNIKEHLELYKGYVKFSNEIVNRIRAMPKNEESAYELSLLQRRFAYEHDSMKNHETFFEQFEGGPAGCKTGGAFLAQVSKDFDSFDALVSCLKGLAMTRGVGWTMLYYCHSSGHFFPQWVDEHHIGLLAGPRIILALDMWEHAFVYDYPTSEKKKYVEAFFENLNWTTVERRFEKQH